MGREKQEKEKTHSHVPAKTNKNADISSLPIRRHRRYYGRHGNHHRRRRRCHHYTIDSAVENCAKHSTFAQ